MGQAPASAVDGSGTIKLVHDLSARQVDILLAGGIINWKRRDL